MTKNEMQELDTLGLDETAPADAMLHAEPNGIEPNRKRRTRSDKGARRAPKMVTDKVAADLPVPRGAINQQQAAQLVRLAEIMCASQQKLDEARRENHQALNDYCKYVESLTQSE
jgi:hypothetical protein